MTRAIISGCSACSPPEVKLRSRAIANPASFLGLDDRVGSLRPGLDADIVVWAGDPLDVNTRAESVYISGRAVYRHVNGVGTALERSERFAG